MSLKYSFLSFLSKIKLLTGYYKKVEFSNLSGIEPVSRLFGIERGQPVDRYYIEKFLGSNRNLIRGKILEVASDGYSRKFTGNSAKPEFHIMCPERSPGPNSFDADLTRPETLPGNQYDCFTCTQTYNFIYEVQEAVKGTHLLLKNDGVLLATVSGISQISNYDKDRWGDYWRFTAQSVSRLFGEVFGNENVEVVTYGNLMASMAHLQGLAIEDLPEMNLLDTYDPDYPVIIGIKAKKVVND